MQEAQRTDGNTFKPARHQWTALEEPHKTVMEKLFFEREDLEMTASALNLTPRQIERLFAEAVDLLRLED